MPFQALKFALAFFLLLETCCQLADAQTFGRLRIGGKTQVDSKRGKINLKIGSVTNIGSPNYICGTIEFAVWATRTRYKGRGRLRGNLLQRCTIDGIPGGDGYNRIRCSAFLPYIRRGSYYITVTASEFDGNEYLIEDSVNLDKKFRF